jgi:hypothetical protein
MTCCCWLTFDGEGPPGRCLVNSILSWPRGTLVEEGDLVVQDVFYPQEDRHAGAPVGEARDHIHEAHFLLGIPDGDPNHRLTLSV